jgi:hypothetical protein
VTSLRDTVTFSGGGRDIDVTRDKSRPKSQATPTPPLGGGGGCDGWRMSRHFSYEKGMRDKFGCHDMSRHGVTDKSVTSERDIGRDTHAEGSGKA